MNELTLRKLDRKATVIVEENDFDVRLCKREEELGIVPKPVTTPSPPKKSPKPSNLTGLAASARYSRPAKVWEKMRDDVLEQETPGEDSQPETADDIFTETRQRKQREPVPPGKTRKQMRLEAKQKAQPVQRHAKRRAETKVGTSGRLKAVAPDNPALAALKARRAELRSQLDLIPSEYLDEVERKAFVEAQMLGISALSNPRSPKFEKANQHLQDMRFLNDRVLWEGWIEFSQLPLRNPLTDLAAYLRDRLSLILSSVQG